MSLWLPLWRRTSAVTELAATRWHWVCLTLQKGSHKGSPACTNQSLPPKDLPVQEERLTGRGRYRDRPSHFCVFNGEGQQGCHQGPVGMDPERGAQHMDRREKTPWEANPTCAKALRPAACSVWPGDGRLTLAWQRRLFLFGTPRD